MDVTNRPTRAREARRHPRWVESRMVSAFLHEREHPGMTGDLSLGGMRLALVGADAREGDGVFVEVAFEERTFETTGRIAYSTEKPWGCVVGVTYAEGSAPLVRFLEARYARGGRQP